MFYNNEYENVVFVFLDITLPDYHLYAVLFESIELEKVLGMCQVYSVE